MATNKLSSRIPPPDAIIEAADRGKLVLFVGAGISRLAGSPGWEQFASKLLEWLIAQGKINHSEYEQLSKLPAKTRISISLNIIQDKKNKLSLIPEDYRKMLMSRDPKKIKKGHDLYRNITSISRLLVTTNYDEWLEFTYPDTDLNAISGTSTAMDPNPAKRRFVCSKDEFQIARLQSEHVIHLHGSLVIPDSMILTTSDYLHHYQNDRGEHNNPVTAFLHHLFQKGGWTVLFLGYGLEEMEVLEYVLQKSHVIDERSDGAGPRHFMLRGFYSHQEELVPHLSEYYQHHCGVRLTPFLMDDNGHDQLAIVLADWAKRIRAKPLPPLEKRMELARLLDG